MMKYKNKLILFPIFLVATLFIFGTSIHKKSAGAPPYYAGAPSEQTCSASGCHDGVTGVDNIGTGTCDVIVGNNYTTYAALDTYTIKVQTSQTACNKFGFQIVALINSGNLPAGDAFVTDIIRTQRRDNTNVTWGCCPNRQWIEHTSAGNTALATGSTNWTYKWATPSSNVGPITFYLATLAANGNGNDSLDYTYTRMVTITYDSTTGSTNAISNITFKKPTIQIFPNPATKELSISGIPTTAKNIEVYDLNGRQLLEHTIQTWNIETINIASFKSGIYLLKITSANAVQTLKFVKQ